MRAYVLAGARTCALEGEGGRYGRNVALAVKRNAGRYGHSQIFHGNGVVVNILLIYGNLLGSALFLRLKRVSAGF